MEDQSSDENTRSNREFFDDAVPLRLQRALLKSVFENYKEASRHCYRTFQPAQAKDLSGSYRRAKIEDEWSGIAALFPDVQVTICPYENLTGSYNELTCGQVKITQSCITSPDVVPRYAVFRKTLAENGQLDLFEYNDVDSERTFLYGILTHGVDSKSARRSRPAFARVQFPNQDCTEYVDDGIDLFKRFPEIVSEYIAQPTMTEVRPQRRKTKRAERA
jgi:hypothetical protein